MMGLQRHLSQALVRRTCLRQYSGVHFNGSDADVEYLIESNLVRSRSVCLAVGARWVSPAVPFDVCVQSKEPRRKADESPSRLLTTRREALSL
jgi:hypothetical protein